jgi:hypothetical protein
MGDSQSTQTINQNQIPSEEFNIAFNNYFNFTDPIKQREARKLFKCTMTGLRNKYPLVFIYSAQKEPIHIVYGKEDEAREIMKKLYIPELYKDQEYYYYPSGQIYVKRKTKDTRKFHEIYNDPKVKTFKESKELKKYLIDNYSDKYSPNQLTNLAYRLTVSSESKNNTSETKPKIIIKNISTSFAVANSIPIPTSPIPKTN